MEPGPETCWVWRTTRCITGTVVLASGSVVVVVVVVPAVVVVLFVEAGPLVLVTGDCIVVGSEAAPPVLAGRVGVLEEEPGAVEAVVAPIEARPEPPGNAGPDELAAALEREWTGR